jgi:hypothetical protein
MRMAALASSFLYGWRAQLKGLGGYKLLYKNYVCGNREYKFEN